MAFLHSNHQQIRAMSSTPTPELAEIKITVVLDIAVEDGGVTTGVGIIGSGVGVGSGSGTGMMSGITIIVSF